jgi:hypothetical protein
MGVTAAAGGGEPGRPAGSRTSALEKNNSGILFNRQPRSSKICTEPMGRRMACNSELAAPVRATIRLDRSVRPCPLSHCSLVQCGAVRWLARRRSSARAHQKKEAAQESELERKPEMRCVKFVRPRWDLACAKKEQRDAWSWEAASSLVVLSLYFELMTWCTYVQWIGTHKYMQVHLHLQWAVLNEKL